MSARQAMRQRCTIERKAETSDGGGGRTLVWSAIHTALPCAAWSDGIAQTVIGGDKLTTIEARCVIVPLGTDVTQEDRIAQVADRLGNVLLAGPMSVTSVAHRADHLQIYVREIA